MNIVAPGDGRRKQAHAADFGLVFVRTMAIIFLVEPKRLPSPPYNPGVRNLVREKNKGLRPVAPGDVERGFRGWHERGYLPHRDEPGLIQFVTFRLADAFPERLRSEWAALLKIEDNQKRKVELETYLDKGHGAAHLRRPEIAKIVEDSLRFRHDQDYELRAWVIMPNHVHLLFRTLNRPMSQLVDAWKGFTAKQANSVLRRRGKFWQDGFWDTFMRDEEHERWTRKYIEKNPMKAGLVPDPKEWPWGSARFRDIYERLCLPD